MIADAAPGASGVTGAPRLELTGVCKAFGGVPAVIDMLLAASSEEIHALVGENGAGKSTGNQRAGGHIHYARCPKKSRQVPCALRSRM